MQSLVELHGVHAVSGMERSRFGTAKYVLYPSTKDFLCEIERPPPLMLSGNIKLLFRILSGYRLQSFNSDNPTTKNYGRLLFVGEKQRHYMLTTHHKGFWLHSLLSTSTTK